MPPQGIPRNNYKLKKTNDAKEGVYHREISKEFQTSAAKFSVIQSPLLLEANDLRILCFDLVLQ